MKRLSVREWSLISERQGVGDGLVFKSLVILYVSAFIIYETALGVPRFFLHPLRGVCDCFTVCGCPNEPDSRPRACHICHRVDFFFTQDAEFLSGLFPNIAAATRRTVSRVCASALDACRKTGSTCAALSIGARPSNESTVTLRASASLTRVPSVGVRWPVSK